jgi:hypothetical protein
MLYDILLVNCAFDQGCNRISEGRENLLDPQVKLPEQRQKTQCLVF